MARAQLAALACAGLLVGVHDEVGSVAARTELAPVVSCWQEASADVRERLQSLERLRDGVGDPALFQRAAVTPRVTPAWLSCFP